MVYKRYIKRGEKNFGPYYYESYRDRKGISRTRMVDAPKKDFKIAPYLSIGFLFLVIIFLFFPLEKGFGNHGITGYFTGAGSGTAVDPFLITTCAQLQEMNDSLTSVYHLSNNIDCDVAPFNTGSGFGPVGNITDPFLGNLSGEGFNITDLFINRSTQTYVGLFGVMEAGGVIENISFVDANVGGDLNVGIVSGENKGLVKNLNIEGGNLTSESSGVGSIAARLGSGGSIINSHSTANVTRKNPTAFYAGGLVGWALAGSLIANSSYRGDVVGGKRTGGLVGICQGTISGSYTTGSVSGSGAPAVGLGRMGGICGTARGLIENSYSCSNITNPFDNTGGLVGLLFDGTLLNTYSAGDVFGQNVNDHLDGGLVGQRLSGSCGTSSFWNLDVQTFGINVSDCDTTSNTSSMVTKSTFTTAGWDFTNIWKIDDGASYPYLQWQDEIACVAHPKIISPAPSPPSSGGGPSINEDFEIIPNLFHVILKPGEQKSSEFTIENIGTIGTVLSIHLSEDIKKFVTLDDDSAILGVGDSKEIGMVSSAGLNTVPGIYNGEIKVWNSKTEFVYVTIEILEVIIGPIQILPVKAIPGVPKTPGTPSTPGSGSSGSGAPPTPEKESLAKDAVKNIASEVSSALGDPALEGPLASLVEKNPLLFTGIVTIILWIILWLLLLVYFIIRKYVKLKNQITGYKSKEDKIAAVNRLKKSSRKANIFERTIDKAAISLVNKVDKIKK